MPHSTASDRRRFLECFASLGLSSTLFPGVLWAQLQQSPASPHHEPGCGGEAVNLNVGRLEEIRKRVLGINGTENRVKATEVLQNHPLSLALQNFSQKGRVLKTTFATRNRLKILWASLSAKIRNSAKTNVQVPDRRSGSYR
jgi:hypothetical protein